MKTNTRQRKRPRRITVEQAWAYIHKRKKPRSLPGHYSVTTLKAKEAWAIVGGLGDPSKMPGKSYGLPAAECKVGGRLRLVPGSPCFQCYAFMRGKYGLADVQAAQYRRFDSLGHPQWVEAMITLIAREKEPYFRWHDSGDVQSLEHLLAIFAVAYALPRVRFWLPTQEHALIALVVKLGIAIPANLVIRLSAPKVDIKAPLRALGLPTSSVRSTDATPAGAYTCPAPRQQNQCGSCRACWDPAVSWVNYHVH